MDPARSTLSVIIDNHHPRIRRGWIDALGEVAPEVSVVPPTRGLTASVLLHDSFGCADGWAGVDRILGRGTPVLVVSWSRPPDHCADLLDAGLVGYVSKGAHLGQVVWALRRVARGSRAVAPPRSSVQVAGDWPGRELGLGSQEAETLVLAVMGLSNPEIAAVTTLSIGTVKTYIRSALAKLGVDSPAAVAGWVQPRPAATRQGDEALPAR